jgi:hypothetical protein
MSSTITAMFDSRTDAEAAKDRLKAANIDADHVHVHDKSSDGYNESGYSTHQDRGMWESIKNAFLPDEDRHTYEEGVRRGAAVLTADVDDDRVAEAVRVLDGAGCIDIDDRASQWRSSGWEHRTGGSTPFGALAEEQLVVGKRAVSDGGVHVRSYVTETPLHEQIRLRKERR